jgi:oxygen-independent coproporphyrinogen-3 oxidase
MNALIEKYNVPAPRYTSYPPVPYWDKENFEPILWKHHVVNAFNKTGSSEGISLYIHLPYCESLCTYCGCNTRITINHSVESTYIATVLREWDMYLELFEKKTPKIKELHLGGGTPTFFSANNLELLVNGILQHAVIDSATEFSFEGHPNNTTEQHLRTLYKLGFRRVSFGIQDFDPKVQLVINRIQSFGQVEYVTNLARTIGYTSVNFDLVYGLPLQTLESVIDTVNKVKSLKPDRIAFYSYAHVPWAKPGQRKFTELDLPDNETKRNLYETGRKMLEEVGYEEIGMDHFALPSDALYEALKNKTLHRNFMGYTPCHTSMLIGLGCSSISDAGTAFAQNTKKVEDYISHIHQNELNVSTGHFLTDTDQVLRQHILNLMCKYETSWENADNLYNGMHETVMQLKEMELDGLVELMDNSVKITTLGKPFVRNICMAFDERLQPRTSLSPVFSKVI